MVIITNISVMQVSAGTDHSLFLTAAGEAYGCGKNDRFQLGDSIDLHCDVPSRICLPAGGLKRVAAGGSHSLFLTRKGFLYGCGQNVFGQVGCDAAMVTGADRLVKQPSPISFGDGEQDVRIRYCVAASHASGAVSVEGTFYTWGDCVEGQLAHPRGDEDPTFHHFSATMRTALVTAPRAVEGASGLGSHLALGGGKRLTKGAGHGLYLTREGGLWSAGLNRHGQLGRETAPVDYGCVSPRSSKGSAGGNKASQSDEVASVYDTQATPTAIDGAAHGGEAISTMAAGGEHTAYVTQSGRLFLCGDGSHSQIGARQPEGESVAVPVVLPGAVVEVACGTAHTVAVTQSGECFVWGDFTSSPIITLYGHITLDSTPY